MKKTLRYSKKIPSSKKWVVRGSAETLAKAHKFGKSLFLREGNFYLVVQTSKVAIYKFTIYTLRNFQTK